MGRKYHFNNDGWTEIKTTETKITSLGNNPFTTIEDWILFNKKFPKIGRKRKTCNCCKKKWEKLSGNVNLVFTNQGNKVICDNCYQFFLEKFGNK